MAGQIYAVYSYIYIYEYTYISVKEHKDLYPQHTQRYTAFARVTIHTHTHTKNRPLQITNKNSSEPKRVVYRHSFILRIVQSCACKVNQFLAKFFFQGTRLCFESQMRDAFYIPRQQQTPGGSDSNLNPCYSTFTVMFCSDYIQLMMWYTTPILKGHHPAEFSSNHYSNQGLRYYF